MMTKSYSSSIWVRTSSSFQTSATDGAGLSNSKDLGEPTSTSILELVFQGAPDFNPVTQVPVLDAVIARAPDAILMMDRGGDHATAATDLWAMPALSGTPAAATGTLIRMEGLKLLGFGPRTPEAAQALHDALYGG